MLLRAIRFYVDESDKERNIVAPALPVAFAVAASSAFPPLFPPIAISNEILSCDLQDFPNPLYLTDGGVYDNLGIDRIIWYHKLHNDLDTFLISDAEGNFDWELDKQYTFITSRNIRASDLLMKRVSTLQYEKLAPYRDSVVFIDIDKAIHKPGDTGVLSPQIQNNLRNIRTDLDAFSPLEAICLISHGYTVARERLIEKKLITDTVPAFSWKPLPHSVMSPRNELRKIRESRRRKLRLWSYQDWVSWVSLFVVASLVLAISLPIYLRQQILVEKAAIATDNFNTLAELSGANTESKSEINKAVIAREQPGLRTPPLSLPSEREVSLIARVRERYAISYRVRWARLSERRRCRRQVGKRSNGNHGVRRNLSRSIRRSESRMARHWASRSEGEN